MEAKKIIRRAMEINKVTQKELADVLGMNSQQALGRILTHEGSMRLDNFIKILEVMGYDVVVRRKIGKSEEWKVE